LHTIVKPPTDEPKKKKRKGKKFKRITRETRFVRLRTLNCYPDVHARLLDGWTLNELAKYIQEERKEYTDVKRGSLIQVLNEYKSSIPKTELISRRIPTFMNNVKAEIENQKNTLTELWRLYDMQLTRIQRVLEQEAEIGISIPTVTKDIQAAEGIVNSIHEIEADLGIAKRHLGKIEVENKVTSIPELQNAQPTVASVLQNPVSRHKVLTIAERIISLSANDKVMDTLAGLLEKKKAQRQEEEDEATIDAEYEVEENR